MTPTKVDRTKITKLTDLPNVGPATAGDLKLLGFRHPEDLRGQDPYAMYDRLCRITNVRHDSCVIDVFISVTHFINGGKAKPWWDFTEQRKRTLAKLT